MSYTFDAVCNRYTTRPSGYLHISCGSSSVLANLQPHPPGYSGRLCDSTGNQSPTPKKQRGMIEEEPPDPIEEQGPVGGGDPDLEIRNDPAFEILTPLAAQQRSPDSLPDFEGYEYQAHDAFGDPENGGPPEEEEIPASPITLGAQIEQIEAYSALAEQLQADEQMLADNALARQLQAPHSITAPRVCPDNGQIPEPTNTPGARRSRDRYPTSRQQRSCGTHSAASRKQSEKQEQTPRHDPRHPRRSSDTDNSSDICYGWSFSSASRSP